MSAYMDLNGIPASGNRWLFVDVLRAAFGFEGFVVSDANAVRNLLTHGFARDLTDAGVRALSVGLDMEMAIVDAAYSRLPQALEAGEVSEEDLDACVRRVLEAKLRLGLFDSPYVDEDRAREVLADPAHREVARVAAERCAVLLRNEGDLLPLDAEALNSVAVIGPLADSKRDTLGPWVFDFDLAETVTVLEGIRGRAGDQVKVEYAPGIRPAQRKFASMFDMWGGNAPEDPVDFDDEAELQRAVELAGGADVAVLVLGEWQNMIGEGASRSSLELPGRQLELLQAVVATGTPVVLLVLNGRPLDLRWAADHVPAIMSLWYPGTQGGTAAANLLFGDVSPAGRLPFTWPRTVGQVPMFYAHTHSHDPHKQGTRYWDEESTPLFRFGYGLSYSILRVRQPQPRPGHDRPRGQHHGLGRGAPTPEAARRTRWCSSTSTSDTGRRLVRSGSSRDSVGSASPRVSRRSASSALDRPSGATGTLTPGTGCSTHRPSTSGSAATRPPSSGPRSR